MTPNLKQRMVRFISSLLVITGLLFLGMRLIPGVELNIALPLVFLMLGAASFVIGYLYWPEYRWAAYLYIPGGLLLSFGVIFLLNVLTGDLSAWAYAWLLLIAGTALGVVMAARRLGWRQEIILASGSTVFLSVTLFAVFGAIAGGVFIQVMAPLLLVLGGMALRWSGLEKLLAERFFHRRENTLGERNAGAPLPVHPGLIEPLSKREIEVLRLIDQGLSNAQIADRLTLAQSTVKTHINNIYGKLEVQTRTQAVRRARELGIFEESAQ